MEILFDSHKELYYRNNKSKFKKNLRCFPVCAGNGMNHQEKGFCGSSIKVTVIMRSEIQEVAWDRLLIAGALNSCDPQDTFVGAEKVESFFQDMLNGEISAVDGRENGVYVASFNNKSFNTLTKEWTLELEFNAHPKNWSYNYKNHKHNAHICHAFFIYVYCRSNDIYLVNSNINRNPFTRPRNSGYNSLHCLDCLHGPEFHMLCIRRVASESRNLSLGHKVPIDDDSEGTEETVTHSPLSYDIDHNSISSNDDITPRMRAQSNLSLDSETTFSSSPRFDASTTTGQVRRRRKTALKNTLSHLNRMHLNDRDMENDMPSPTHLENRETDQSYDNPLENAFATYSAVCTSTREQGHFMLINQEVSSDEEEEAIEVMNTNFNVTASRIPRDANQHVKEGNGSKQSMKSMQTLDASFSRNTPKRRRITVTVKKSKRGNNSNVEEITHVADSCDVKVRNMSMQSDTDLLADKTWLPSPWLQQLQDSSVGCFDKLFNTAPESDYEHSNSVRYVCQQQNSINDNNYPCPSSDLFDDEGNLKLDLYNYLYNQEWDDGVPIF